MSSPAPVIIIGMHRSGTTMIAEMLRKLGLFIGKDLESNAESRFFIGHNEWLLRQCGATWHTPLPVDLLSSSEELVALATDYMRIRLAGVPAIQYLGWRSFISGMRPLGRMEWPWGWKDPRMTFTLPFWLRLFPDARIIHIYRNGVPVAASLRTRSRNGLRRSRIKHERSKHRRTYSFRAKNNGYVDSVRCLELDGGFSLWETYVSRSLEMTDKLGLSAYTLKYEDFLETPAPMLKNLAAFCGLDAPEERIDTIVSGVRKERARAFLENEELSRYYDRMKETPLMTLLGYDGLSIDVSFSCSCS